MGHKKTLWKYLENLKGEVEISALTNDKENLIEKVKDYIDNAPNGWYVEFTNDYKKIRKLKFGFDEYKAN